MKADLTQFENINADLPFPADLVEACAMRLHRNSGISVVSFYALDERMRDHYRTTAISVLSLVVIALLPDPVGNVKVIEDWLGDKEIG